jgi:tetratricopeptide (TPR) repeat protein
VAVLDFYGESPQEPFAAAARPYSLAKLALLDGDLVAAERHYRDATAGFSQLDRPVMVSMCLGMVADFDERAGDFPAAIEALEQAIATNEALIGGFTGSLLARLGWVLLLDGQLERAEEVYQRALDAGRRVRHNVVVFLALTGVAALHRINGRDDAAAQAALEALEHHRTGEPRRFRNRVDHDADMGIAAATCCTVLAAIAAERDQPEEAAELLGRADRLRSDAGAEIPVFQRGDLERARAAARSGLDEATYLAAVERGRLVDASPTF